MSLLSFLLLLAAALFLALFTDRIFRHARRRSGRWKSVERGAGRVHQRLAEGRARLERIAAERDGRNDPDFGRTSEDRIVWRELLELELQDVDEEVNRIRETADRTASRRPKGSTEAHGRSS